MLVMRYEREEIGTGGASNVARNLWALGGGTILVGAVGRDAEGRELLRQLDQDLVDVTRVATVPTWSTPTKTRILGAEPGRTVHQVLRIDREPDHPLGSEVTQQVAEQVRALAGEVEAVLVSDYGYGIVDEVVASAIREVQAAGALLVLDPRRTLDPFRGASAMTPNLAELGYISGVELDEPSFVRGCRCCRGDCPRSACSRASARHTWQPRDGALHTVDARRRTGGRVRPRRGDRRQRRRRPRRRPHSP